MLLKTSAGDIDIELWSKEAPKACRNFVQLCMEGKLKTNECLQDVKDESLLLVSIVSLDVPHSTIQYDYQI